MLGFSLVTISANRATTMNSPTRTKAMPSVSQSQSRLMAAAAHTPGGYGGVPQSVGKKFNKADTGKKRSNLPQRVNKLKRRGLISERAMK